MSIFPQWGDDETLFKCELTSLANVTATGGVETGAGNHSYTKKGYLGGATSGLKWNNYFTTAQKDELYLGCTITSWVEKGFFDTSRAQNATNEFLFGLRFSAINCAVRPANSDFIAPQINGGLVTNNNRASLSDVGKDEYVRVDVCGYPGGGSIMYIDHVPYSYSSDWLASANEFNNLTIGSSVSSPNSPIYHRTKKVMISKKRIINNLHYTCSNIFIAGHSYMAQGDYDSSNGYLKAATSSGFSADADDATMTPTIHRELAKRGISMADGRIKNHADAGTKLNDAGVGLSSQIDAAITNHGTFKVAIIMYGANEIDESDNDWGAEYGPSGTTVDWETAYQTEITRLVNNGAEIILLLNQPYFSHNQSQGRKDRTDACNVMVQSLVDANPQCHLIDLWTHFGGNTISAEKWTGIDGLGNSHPSKAMSHNIGKLCANKILSLI